MAKTKLVTEPQIVWRVTVTVKKPYKDSWLRKPSTNDVLSALRDMIDSGELDDHFEITVEKKEAP